MGTSHAEGEALRRLIEKWRDRADDIPHRTPEMPASEWALRLCADELEAALAPLSGPVDASREPEFVCGNDMGQVCREFWPGSPGSWCNGCVNRELHEAAQWRAHGVQGVAATVKASPDDWPAARLVTPQELRTFLSETIAAAAAAVPSSPAQEPRKMKPRPGLHAEDRCDCGQPIAGCCIDCAVADYQASNPTCATCCPIRPALPPSWEGDLPTEHLNRCKLRDRLLYADIFNDDGSHRAVWRCHKREGHEGPCSSHNDCGVMNGGVVCGHLPGHAGPHAWETRISASAPSPSAGSAKDKE